MTVLLTGSDRASIGSWLRDLTYAEVHAATLGAMFGAGAVAAHAIGMPGLALGLLVSAFVLLGWTRTSRTEDVPFVSSVVSSVPASLRGQIRSEPHYFGGAFLAVAVLAMTVWVLLP